MEEMNNRKGGSFIDSMLTEPLRQEDIPKRSIKKLILNFRVELAILAIEWILLYLLHLKTGTAMKPVNLKNVLQVASPYTMLAMGQLLVLITGGIDLSMGSVFSLSGMVGSAVMYNYGIPAGVLAMLAVGLAFGLFNGFLITRTGLAPFIVTLATSQIASSLAYIVTNGTAVSVRDFKFRSLNYGQIIPGLPNFILYIIIVTVIFQFILIKSNYGRQIYATGSNETVARLVGIPTKRIKVSVYMIASCMAVLGAIINTSYIMIAECSVGSGYELTAVASCVIGGTSMTGGIGTPLGALIGVFFVTIIKNGINLLGINTFWSGTVTGCVILLAVLTEKATRLTRLNQNKTGKADK